MLELQVSGKLFLESNNWFVCCNWALVWVHVCKDGEWCCLSHIFMTPFHANTSTNLLFLVMCILLHTGPDSYLPYVNHAKYRAGGLGLYEELYFFLMILILICAWMPDLIFRSILSCFFSNCASTKPFFFSRSL